MSKFLNATTAGLLAGVAALVVGCQAPQENDSLDERFAAVDEAIAELRSQIQANQEEILKQFRSVKGGQQTMIRRGVVIAPEAMEKPISPGDQTGVKIGDAPSLGPADAPIEVVEFADFQCPYCIKNARFLRALTEAHPGQVRVGFRHYPLARHKEALPAAKAAWAAQQQGKFWEMHDALFSSKGELTPEVIRGHAEAIGLDMEKFDRDVESPAASTAVFSDRRGGKKAGVRGTPSYYVNGRMVGGNSASARNMVEKAIAEQAKKEPTDSAS